jgi:hypothetical protein
MNGISILFSNISLIEFYSIIDKKIILDGLLESLNAMIKFRESLGLKEVKAVIEIRLSIEEVDNESS